jgi:cytochrome o ubiquinol oxidase subunit 2
VSKFGIASLKPAAGLLVAGALLAGCTEGVLDPAGPIGAAQRQILVNSLAIMLAIVVPTILATLGFAWWFRAGNRRATYRPNWAFSGQIELVVWSIPTMTIMLLGGVSWLGSHALDPAKPIESEVAPLEVQVVSLDWKWLFIYPQQQVASVNSLVIPAGRPVHFTLTSASVMNAFFVPRLGSMIYTMNGMTSQLYLQADQPGEFPGLSSHFSGDGFSDMHFTVRALAQDGFDKWAESLRPNGPVLDAPAYAALARQGTQATPFTYRGVEDGLFNRIVALSVPPGPGPVPESSGHPTSTARQ